MGKLTISMAIFNSFLYVYQRVLLVCKSTSPHKNPHEKRHELAMNSSLGWFKGKSTGNHGFYHQNPSNIGLSCKFSHHPIL